MCPARPFACSGPPERRPFRPIMAALKGFPARRGINRRGLRKHKGMKVSVPALAPFQNPEDTEIRSRPSAPKGESRHEIPQP